MLRTLLYAAAAAFVFPANVIANTNVDLEDVPENVLETAQRTAPGVTFTKVSIEAENGVDIYEFEATDHEGKHIEIDVFENGELEEIEMETELSDVPNAVLATLKEHAPDFEPAYIEFSARQSGTQYVYEFEGEHEGDLVEIEIAENGELLFSSMPSAAVSVMQTSAEKTASD